MLKNLYTTTLLGIVLAASTRVTAQHFSMAGVAIAQDTLCVKTDMAHMIFPGSHDTFDALYKKLAKHLATGTNRINVLHIGGSHVQAGYLSGRLRDNVSNMHDSTGTFCVKAADRGFIFPFEAVGTNAPKNYSISHTGKWRASKCISDTPDAELGICGIAAITNDHSATLTLYLPDETYSFNQLRVLGYSDRDDCFPIIIMEADTIFPAINDHATGYLFHLPSSVTCCTVSFCNVDDSCAFVLRGLMPKSDRNGITYTESGVNGAAVTSWLICKALKEELKLLPPDLIVFGIGINDAATTFDNFNPDTFKDNYRELINEIKQVMPSAALLFITNNDCNQSVRIRKPNLNTARVAQAFKELAQEYNGAVFDLYQTMGGQGSAANWVHHKLMQRDRVHFTSTGYQLVGDLIYNAVAEDFEKYVNRQSRR